ncbi:CmcJ/NvfI family oxidoreductase [Noviherbaspirillum aerium]|uniref:CmcJ/NvfI family oxidoreductase n=1 Tax=Noviherbaspirillum aerium TaxID=2588497 RepID=UPI00124CA300|nr:CmcJ/NvfI family oxidoreductase [Noviherbaspirillum aerium]
MNAHAAQMQQHAFVTGNLGYLAPSQDKPYQYMTPPPAGAAWHNTDYEQRACRIVNARRVAASLSLEDNGFELLDCPSKVADFNDAAQVQGVYYRELEQLALELTGGLHALVFDHQLRQREAGRTALGFGREAALPTPTALGRVHNDYTESSGPRRLRQLMPEMAQDHPFLILNFWRPVAHAAIDTPLALCDARSFAMQDWACADLIYPDRKGEIYLGRYADGHRWYYYPAMTPEDMLVFVSFDSRLDSTARMTPHCAFDDPLAPEDAPPRRSIEARCLVILD